MISRPIDGIACTCLMKAMIDSVAAEESIWGPSYVMSLAIDRAGVCELGLNTC